MKPITEAQLNDWYMKSTLQADDIILMTGRNWDDLTYEEKAKIHKQQTGKR